MAGILPGTPTYLRPRGGIALGLYPSSDPTCDLELHRADPGSTATFTPIVRLGVGSGQGVMQYVDGMPVDTLTRFYKLRSVKDGLTASAFTNTVSAKPTVIPNGPIATPPLSGSKIGVTAWISSAAAIKVGSPQSTGAVRKSLRFIGTVFAPLRLAVPYKYDAAGAVSPGTSGFGHSSMAALLPLPQGVILTRVRISYTRPSTKGGAGLTVAVGWVSTARSITTLCTLTATRSANYPTSFTKQSSSFAGLLVGSSISGIVATLDARNSSVASTGLGGSKIVALNWIELTYKQGTYTNSY